MNNAGLRIVNGVNVLPIDGLWKTLENIPTDEKISQALEYSGCKFHDNDRKLVHGNVLALVGVGGVAIAHEVDTNSEIETNLHGVINGAREMMGSAAAFSYLNSSERSIESLYKKVTSSGHLSITHTVQLNFILAGISEGTELELNLQRDLIHISKLTNTRTKVQNMPPIVVPNPENAKRTMALYQQINEVAAGFRTDESGDTLEFANSMYPINKATILMLSGDLSNLKKLAQIRNDAGKERELRGVAYSLYEQLSVLWPEIFKDKE